MSLLSKIQNHWGLNEGSGTITTDGFGGRDGTLTDAALWEAAGKIDGGIANDGTTSRYISVSDLPFPTTGAISFWLKTASTNRQNILSFAGNITYLRFAANYQPGTAGGTPGAIGFQRQSASGAPAFAFRSDVGTALHDGDWHHIVVNFNTQNAGSPEIYFDGVAQSVTVSASNLLDGQTFDAAIGSAVTGATPGDNLNGSLDALMLFDDMLTAGEVAQLYSGGVGLELVADLRLYTAYTVAAGRLRRIS